MTRSHLGEECRSAIERKGWVMLVMDWRRLLNDRKWRKAAVVVNNRQEYYLTKISAYNGCERGEMFQNLCMYYVYVLTNHNRSVLYVGVTNNLRRRVFEHTANRGKPKTFAGRYHCYKLIYYEEFTSIIEAIKREKEIKLMCRAKKLELIKEKNPKLHFFHPPN
jgi:putative endonuclease